MTSDTLDLAALEARIRERLLDRYSGRDVVLQIGIAAHGRLRIAVWPTRASYLCIQWLHVDADGVITFPRPDDGTSSIAVNPRWVHRTSGMDEATERVVILVDAGVAATQERVDARRKELLADWPSLVPTEEQVRAACSAWTTSDDHRRLLNACAWVQLGDWAFDRRLPHSVLNDARQDAVAMGHAATLVRAVDNARTRTIDQWCAESGWPVPGVAVRALTTNLAEDERIAREVKWGLLHLPLWDVSPVSPVSPDPALGSLSDGSQPRWVFEITGEFRALPVSLPHGEQADRVLICGGSYRVESATQDGPATRVRLSYRDSLGNSSVANPVLLEIAARVPGVTKIHLEGPLWRDGETSPEKIALGLAGNREFVATAVSQHPDRIITTFRPDGTFDEGNLDTDGWTFAPSDGRTMVSLPADARLITAHVERLADPRWLACRTHLIGELLESSVTDGDPPASNGSFDLPVDGYVQWTRVTDSESDVYIEINEGEYPEPMPTVLVELLVMFGWNAPDDDARNCWLRAGPPASSALGGDWPSFFDAANSIIIAVTIAMGVSLEELWVALGGEAEPIPRPVSVEVTTWPGGLRQTMVMTARRDEKGWLRRELREEEDGTLVIEGHDLGSGVSDSWGDGMGEYEFTRTLSRAAVAELRLSLGIGDAPLLEELGSRFETTLELEEYLEANGIESAFWSWVTD